MSSIKDSATKFFDACEAGLGWEVCQQYCHPDATFSAQAPALGDIDTVEGYTAWTAGILTPIPDGTPDLRAMAVDEGRSTVIAWSVFSGHYTGEGGPVPANGNRVDAEYCYVMQFDGGRIRHMTKVWNDGVSLTQLGWA